MLLNHFLDLGLFSSLLKFLLPQEVGKNENMKWKKSFGLKKKFSSETNTKIELRGG